MIEVPCRSTLGQRKPMAFKKTKHTAVHFEPVEWLNTKRVGVWFSDGEGRRFGIIVSRNFLEAALREFDEGLDPSDTRTGPLATNGV